MDRIILHSDMNAFFASVECLYHPELRKVPMAVCGDAEQRHGIILAKNQIAKNFGVRTAETIGMARQKCPGLVTVQANHERYMRYSRAARAIYARFTDRVESFGLDECWLDVTGSGALFGSGEQIAQRLRRTIGKELRLTVSVGVSWNKIFAKLGSDYRKPDAVTVVSRENYRRIVWPLPASDLLYVGPATASRLARYGIRTIGDIAAADPHFLCAQLGKCGGMLWSFACGYDVSPVARLNDADAVKSVGNSMTTWRNIENREEAWKVITVLSEHVAERLRAQGLRARTVQISFRDSGLVWQERQGKFDVPVCTAGELAQQAMAIFQRSWDFHLPLRALGVRACDLTDSRQGVQLTLYGESRRRERHERLENTVDRIRGRFGREAIRRAVLLGDDITGESAVPTQGPVLR